MSRHSLEALFSPSSVAVIGASTKPDSVGQIVFKNMLDSGFKGMLHPVNPKHTEIQGKKAVSSVADIHEPVDLAVIVTPAKTVPDIIDACGQQHVKAAIIISAGFAETGPEGKALEADVLKKAQRYGIRLIGPNCLGVMRPVIGLNATFNKGGANAGSLAFVSQSGALCTAILDWANTNGVGFSSVVSLGSTADVDFGEILDYLCADAKTQSILLYIEGIRNASSFMSSLRMAARIKPVILIKTGRHQAASKAAFSHTASLAGSDAVFDAAVRRVGAVRVRSVSQLFSVAKALSCGFHPAGHRLAIVTNGGGPGVMATDYAVELGLEMAQLSETTIDALNLALPPSWSHGNPVDIIGDAHADRYHAAVRACLDDGNTDGVMAILTPQAMTKPLDAANVIVELAGQYKKPLIACWMGGGQVEEARNVFDAAYLPSFRTPEPAVEVFSFLSAYYRNQQLLMQSPGPLTNTVAPDVSSAKAIIEGVLQEKRKVLSEMESKAVLSAFRIPIAKTLIAHSAHEALLIAQELGYPVVMKINAEDISHKTDAGGVILNLNSANAVREAFRHLTEGVKRTLPEAKITGVAIEPMIKMANGRELMIGVASDPVFGPIISFGAGGTLVEVMRDHALALPPLNAFLVKDLIDGTKVSKALGRFRAMPPVDLSALENVLLRVSEMVCELPELIEMDINPLIADETGAVAVDARIVVGYSSSERDRHAHMAICPYPTHCISSWQLEDGTNITIRPIRPEDAALERAFVDKLSEQSRYLRFMNSVQQLNPAQLAGFTQIDYSRELALIAVTQIEGKEVEIGVARYIADSDGESCEFAIVVADNLRGKGLGHRLVVELMTAARAKGIKIMRGDVLSNNVDMLNFAQNLGFTIENHPDDLRLKTVYKHL